MLLSCIHVHACRCCINNVHTFLMCSHFFYTSSSRVGTMYSTCVSYNYVYVVTLHDCMHMYINITFPLSFSYSGRRSLTVSSGSGVSRSGRKGSGRHGPSPMSLSSESLPDEDEDI